ncbi:MAG: 2-hydroxyacyl-CoA dehydratase family protein [Pseudomonadota bacterium]
MEGAKPLESMEAFRAVLKDPAGVAKDWKTKGGKVAGVRCLFVPEEIIWAAGMLPWPMVGTPEPVRLADAYFQSCSCEFARNVFDQALEGKLDFLDCAALSNTCDAMRRLYDMWKRYIESSPVIMINNPQKLMTEKNREFFLEELKLFRQRMEEASGEKVTDEKLAGAIELYNETRSLLREIYLLRKQDPPPLTGVEAFEVAMAATIMPKDMANPLLRKLIEELGGRQGPDGYDARILVTGSIIDNPALISMIEEEGGMVVADDLCTTSKYFWYTVEAGKSDDPLDAIYRYLNRRPLCACMHPVEARMDFLMELVEEFKVDAVIDFNLKYCHSFMYEAPLLKRELESRGISTTVLEVGHDMSGHGQLRTRIQAFIEML